MDQTHLPNRKRLLQGERREQHFTPGRFTPIKLPEGPPLEGVAHLLDFPRHRLRLLEKLGEGDFGMVISLVMLCSVLPMSINLFIRFAAIRLFFDEYTCSEKCCSSNSIYGIQTCIDILLEITATNW